LSRAGAKSPFEARVEKAQMVESALLGHINDFDVRISQQRNCFQQAHFHPQRGNRKAKVLMKQAIKMAPTATEFGSQFPNWRTQEFRRRYLFEHLDHVLFDANKPDSLGLGSLELDGQNCSNHSQQLSAVIQIELGRDFSKKLVTFLRERAGRGVRPDPLEGIGDVLQQAYFIARKQRQKVFKAQGKTPKNRLAFIGDT
jgi:hypothetical protein